MKKLSVSIEFTNKCNFKCPICPNSDKKLHYRKKGFINNKVFTKALSECQKYAKTVALGFFGEPTLHANYLEYMDRMNKRNFVLALNTNISLCTKEIMNSWIKARVDSVRLSIDAFNSNVFNNCRPGPVRDLSGRLVSNNDRLDAITEKIEYWLSLPKHRPTRIVFVKSSFNKNEKNKFIKFWKPKLSRKLNDHILFKQILSYGGKIKNPFVRKHKCNIWDVGYLMIGWDGRTSPCNLDVNLELGLGNILNKSITELYYGSRAKELRKSTGCGKNILPCKACTDSNNWSFNEIIK